MQEKNILYEIIPLICCFTTISSSFMSSWNDFWISLDSQMFLIPRSRLDISYLFSRNGYAQQCCITLLFSINSGYFIHICMFNNNNSRSSVNYQEWSFCEHFAQISLISNYDTYFFTVTITLEIDKIRFKVKQHSLLLNLSMCQVELLCLMKITDVKCRTILIMT